MTVVRVLLGVGLLLTTTMLPVKISGQEKSSPTRYVSDKSFWVFEFNVENLKRYNELKVLRSKLQEFEKLFDGDLPVDSLQKITLQVAGDSIEGVDDRHATSLVFNQKLDQAAVLKSAGDGQSTYVKKTLNGRVYWKSPMSETSILMFFGDNVVTVATRGMLESLCEIPSDQGRMDGLLKDADPKADVVFAFQKGKATDEIYDFFVDLYKWGKADKGVNAFTTMKQVEYGAAEIQFSSSKPLRFFVKATSLENAKAIRNVYADSIPYWRKHFQEALQENLRKESKGIGETKENKHNILLDRSLAKLLSKPDIQWQENKVRVEFAVESGSPGMLLWTRNQLFPDLVPANAVEERR